MTRQYTNLSATKKRVGFFYSQPSFAISDASGHFLDWIVDAASIGMDLKDIADEGLNWGNGLTLGADVVLGIVPFVPAGVGWLKRGGKAALEVANHVDDVGDAAHLLAAACSFSSDTLVATEQGDRPINEIEVGDRVLAYDQATRSTGYYTVTAVLVHEDPGIEYLTLDGEQLQTTPEHPFYTQEGGWVAAGDLWVGAHMRKADGSYGVVEQVEVVQRTQKMYNLTVAVAHTFFVGEGHWLVHNTCHLPPHTIVDADGVTITHYYAGGDHGPPHLHVQGRGPQTRIGQNGKPLRNNPELSATQRDVVERHLRGPDGIRAAVRKIGKWYRENNP